MIAKDNSYFLIIKATSGNVNQDCDMHGIRCFPISSQVTVRPINKTEELRYQDMLLQHHYLGALPKIGYTIRYIALLDGEWLGLISYSAAALKCSARDRWIDWGHRLQYDRLNLVANNSRFLILPRWHHKNLASKILSLCKRRIQRDWVECFGCPLLLLETFVDLLLFVGTVYRAANWKLVGKTKEYQRPGNGYSTTCLGSELVFVQPLLSRCWRMIVNIGA